MASSAAAAAASQLGANIFITGANRGIGLGLVREMLKAGGVKNLFAGCRNPDGAKELQSLVASSNSALKIVQIDVASDASIQQAATQVGKVLAAGQGAGGGGGGINLLVNNSGILEKEAPGIGMQQPGREIISRHLDVNTLGPVMTTAAFLPLLRVAASSGQPARVINISSILGRISDMIPLSMVPSKNFAYGMSKAALNFYSTALALDEPQLVVASIHPGWVKTDMGGPDAHVGVDDSVRTIVQRICKLGSQDSGKFFGPEGEMNP